MKIDNSLRSGQPGGIQESRLGKTDASAKKGGGAGGTDVQLSSLSARLQAIESRLSGGEAIDAARVAEIKQAIAEGRFQINPEVIADRLLETVRELLRSHKA